MKITPHTLPSPIRRAGFTLLIAALGLALALPASAQPAAPVPDTTPLGGGLGAPPADGGLLPSAGISQPNLTQAQPVVMEIKIDVTGAQQVSRDAVMSHMLLREGMPFNEEQLDQSLVSLYNTGLYENIIPEREAMAGGVRLLLHVYPKKRVSAVVFNGNKEYSRSRLADEIKTQAGGVLDDYQVKNDTNTLLQFYQKKGYPQVKVDSQVVPNETTGTAVVTFNISEGPDVTISDIKFVGNDHIRGGKLLDQMDTSTYTFFISWITGSGRFQQDVFDDDMDKLRKYYKNQGFLYVDIPVDQVEFQYPKPDKLVLVIHVKEGPQYHVGKITVSGNTIFQTPTLIKQLTLSTGEVFSPEKVDNNTDALRNYYGQFGYLQTVVRADRKPDLNTNNIDLDFTIVESEKYYVQSIVINGNTKTRSTVIVRELALAPGDVFDTVRMKAAENRLKNTRYFDNVVLDDEATTIPGRRDLRVTVNEAKTFNLNFTVGFNTVTSILGTIEMSESNFDLFNYRTFFRGGGQKARISLTYGGQYSQVLVGFEEPWMWQRNLDGGIDLSREQFGYLSSTYNEIVMGMNLYLRKQVIELIEGKLSYTLQNTNINSVTTAAPPPVLAQQGNKSMSRVGFSLIRDTRDSFSFTTDGARYELTNQVAGGPLMGQTNYYRLEANAGKWFPTFAFGNQVFSLVGRAGAVMGYGGKSVPYSDSYFLGGPFNLRGYTYRNVGPRYLVSTSPAFGQPLGGDTQVFFSPEYSIELFNPVRFAVFYDFGYVNSGAYDFNPSQYRHDAGIGFRILVLGAPLRIDLGYPLNPDQSQSSSIQFNFSFGTVF